jgi:hypothetical protein
VTGKLEHFAGDKLLILDGRKVDQEVQRHDANTGRLIKYSSHPSHVLPSSLSSLIETSTPSSYDHLGALGI